MHSSNGCRPGPRCTERRVLASPHKEDSIINTQVTEKGNRKNNEIRVPRVRVIGADGEMVGVLSRDEALALAEESGMDLVEIQPTRIRRSAA